MIVLMNMKRVPRLKIAKRALPVVQVVDEEAALAHPALFDSFAKKESKLSQRCNVIELAGRVLQHQKQEVIDTIDVINNAR